MLALPTSAAEFLGHKGAVLVVRAIYVLAECVLVLQDWSELDERGGTGGHAGPRGAGHRLEVVVELPSTQDETDRGPHMARLAG
jgi:hypothetical protein